MRERDIERRLKKKLETLGCLVLKWVSPGSDGVPDRIIILPGGEIIFAELKAEGEDLRPLQAWWQSRLREQGCRAVTIHGMAEAEELEDVIRTELYGGGLVPQKKGGEAK